MKNKIYKLIIVESDYEKLDGKTLRLVPSGPGSYQCIDSKIDIIDANGEILQMEELHQQHSAKAFWHLTIFTTSFFDSLCSLVFIDSVDFLGTSFISDKNLKSKGIELNPEQTEKDKGPFPF